MIRQLITSGILVGSICFGAYVHANDDWKPYPANLFKPDLNGDNIIQQWPKLTRGTQDALPKDEALLDVWRAHFQGDFAEAKKKGLALGTADGKYAAYRAQTIYAMYMSPAPEKGHEEKAERTVLLKEVADELYAEVQALRKKGQTPSQQILFWGTYAMGRYVEIMKPTWGLLTKKGKVKELLTHADEIPETAGIPGLYGLYGGAYAAIYQDGFIARAVFKDFVKDCQGKDMSGDYDKATKLQFNCALKVLGDAPFPEIYNSYAKALLQLDKDGNKDQAETYRQYATGASVPAGVTNMIFSAEDALARNAVKKH